MQSSSATVTTFAERSFQLGTGRVTYVDESLLGPASQVSPKEDLLQIQFTERLVVDAGWYSGIRQFRVLVVQDHDWQDPIFSENARNVGTLLDAIERAIAFAERRVEALPSSG
ncbi:hypothetical protein [Deinococcus sonorensis]|uniref:Uncharacterized protein n=1 Tax=Deinococcus sonorensis TaxID=309891 RepID=A0ABV8YAG8_9DEIO